MKEAHIMYAVYDRMDEWTGGEHYWIQANERGAFIVMMETPNLEECNAQVYCGSYDSCAQHLCGIIEDNYEYDHGL